MTNVTSSAFSPETRRNLDLWLHSNFCDESTKSKIKELLTSNPQEVENSFYTSLSFGTGGLRGIMGLGPNRMNIYTIRQTTKGIANYLIQHWGKESIVDKRCVVIGYDSRNNSRLFSEETARVFAAFGFIVYLFDSICPTPLVSFACRELNAVAAVMITASHNPPEYNGYKVYWNYGGQVLPPHDEGMIKEVKRVQDEALPVEVVELNHPRIHRLSSSIDDTYFKAIQSNRLWNDDKSSLKVLYSAFHGTGGRLMKRALTEVGVTSLSFVDEQMIPDGNFPTVKKPNPEEKQALQRGIDKMLKEGLDLFIATDPDADRIGVALRYHDQAIVLTGNQIACILLEGIFHRLKETERLPENPGAVKTIVTTQLFKEIAKRWNASCANVLTGFKYVAEQIEAWRRGEDGGCAYVFGAEESYGSLYGLHARDKDAITTAQAICEIAWDLKRQGKTLVDALYDLYRKYGAFYEELLTFSFDETKEGREKMNASLSKLRTNPSKEISGEKVIAFQDLLTHSFQGDQEHKLSSELPPSDVILYTLESGTQIIVRPSGTEPKVKVYLLLRGKYSTVHSIDSLIAHAKEISLALRALFQ